MHPGHNPDPHGAGSAPTSAPRGLRWHEFWSDARSEFEGRVAVLEIDILFEEYSGSARAELLSAHSEVVTAAGFAAARRALEELAQGRPVQYVIGHWPFRTLDLMVDERVLIPRPETEVVVGCALTELDRLGFASRVGDASPVGDDPNRPREGLVAVDLGCGSGAVGLSLAAENPHTKVWMTDFSGEALAVATANLAGLGPAATRVRVCQGDWFAALPPDLRGRCDLIVSNPPYVPDHLALEARVSEWEPVAALRSGPDGLDAISAIIAGAASWLASPGVLVLECDPDQIDAVKVLVGASLDSTARGRPNRPAHGPGEPEMSVITDLAGRRRGLVARFR